MYDVYNMYHSGILGMHWGIRRYQYKDGSLTPEGRKRYAKLEKRLSKTKNEKKASKIQAELDRLSGKMKEEKASEKKFDLKSLSDTDLNTMLNRMQMEKRYYELAADLAEKTKTPEQRKKEAKIRQKEAFKQNLIDTMQRTGLEVLQQGTKKLAGNALDSLFEDAKKANEKNNKKEKSTTDLIKDEQLKQMRLKTEQAERENVAAKQALKESKKKSKQDKNNDKLKSEEETRQKAQEEAQKRADLEDEMRYNARKSAQERQARLDAARNSGKSEGEKQSSSSSFDLDSWSDSDVSSDYSYSKNATSYDKAISSYDWKQPSSSVNSWANSSSSSSAKNFTDSLFAKESSWQQFLNEDPRQKSSWQEFLDDDDWRK